MNSLSFAGGKVSLRGKTRDSDLSLLDLVYLQLPALENVEEIVMSNIKSCADDEMNFLDRSLLLGLSEFNRQPDLQQISKECSDFLKVTFGPGYALEGLSKNESFSDQFNEEEKKKLQSFWQGGAKGSISKSREFQKMNVMLLGKTYINLTSDLQKYIDDGGKKWATQLWESYSTESEMTKIAAEIQMGSKMFQKDVTKLFCLDPNMNYAQSYEESLISIKLDEIVDFFDGSDTEIKKFTELITPLVIDMILKEFALSGLKAEIENAMSELSVVTISDMKVELTKILVGVLQTAFSDSESETVGLKISKSMKEWGDNNSKLTKTFSVASKIAVAVAFSIGVNFGIEVLMSWENVCDEEKSVLVASTAVYCLRYLISVVHLDSRIVEACRTGEWGYSLLKDITKARAGYFNDAGEVLTKSYEAIHHTDSTLEIDLGKSLETMKDVNVAIDRWRTYFSKSSEKQIEDLMIVSSVACAASLGFKIAVNFIDGEEEVYLNAIEVLQSTLQIAKALDIRNVLTPISIAAVVFSGLTRELVAQVEPQYESYAAIYKNIRSKQFFPEVEIDTDI